MNNTKKQFGLKNSKISKRNREPITAPCLLCVQNSNVLVCCGSADVADPCQLADIQLLALVGGVVAKEGGGDVLFAHLRSADLPPLGSGICHARPHSCYYHRQFQLTEYTCHLEKCFAHGVSLTIATSKILLQPTISRLKRAGISILCYLHKIPLDGSLFSGYNRHRHHTYRMVLP